MMMKFPFQAFARITAMAGMTLAFLLLMPASPVSAQQSGGDSSLLPDIDPQDIEIRGDFRARFAGISRQPILGFSPEPRIFRIDPNRMPFMETPEEVVVSLPLSELEPQLGPELELLETPSKTRLLGYAGFGNYISPEARLFGSTGLGERSRLSGNIRFSSSDGHLDAKPTQVISRDPIPSIEGAFRRLNGDLTLTTLRSENSRLLLNLRGRSDFSQVPHISINPNMLLVDRRQHLNTLGGGFGWQQQQSVYDFFEIHTEYAFTTAEGRGAPERLDERGNLVFPYSEYSFDNFEHAVSIGSSYSRAGTSIGNVYKFDLEIDAGFYGRDLSGGVPEQDEIRESRYITGLSGYWQRETDAGNRYRLGARFYAGYDADQEQTFMPVPYARYEYRAPEQLRINLEVGGEMYNRGLETAFAENRLTLQISPLVNEQRYYAKADLRYELSEGIHVDAGLLTARIDRPFMYSSYTNSGYQNSWTHPDNLLLIQPSIGASVAVMPSELTVYADAQLNITDMSEPILEVEALDSFVGYEDYRVTAGMRLVPLSGAQIELWADYLGPRTQLEYPAEPIASQPPAYADDAGEVLLLNLKAEYQFTDLLGVYVKGLNLLDAEYELWNSYQERPLQVYAGLSFRF